MQSWSTFTLCAFVFTLFHSIVCSYVVCILYCAYGVCDTLCILGAYGRFVCILRRIGLQLPIHLQSQMHCTSHYRRCMCFLSRIICTRIIQGSYKDHIISYHGVCVLCAYGRFGVCILGAYGRFCVHFEEASSCQFILYLKCTACLIIVAAFAVFQFVHGSYHIHILHMYIIHGT